MLKSLYNDIFLHVWIKNSATFFVNHIFLKACYSGYEVFYLLELQSTDGTLSTNRKDCMQVAWGALLLLISNRIEITLPSKVNVLFRRNISGIKVILKDYSSLTLNRAQLQNL